MSQKRDVLRRPYTPPVRTGTSGTYDEGRDANQITKSVELNKRGSADSGPRKVRETTGYHPGDAGEVLGKPRGFGRLDVCTRTPLIELFMFYVNRNYACTVNIAIKISMSYHLHV